jgi:hypothetical protein
MASSVVASQLLIPLGQAQRKSAPPKIRDAQETSGFRQSEPPRPNSRSRFGLEFRISIACDQSF